MMQLCLQEQRRRYTKEVTLCCENIIEPGQYGCKNYPNFRPKRKRTPKQYTKKTTPKKLRRKIFLRRKN